MAYDIFPKTVEELQVITRNHKYSEEVISDLSALFIHLKEKFPKLEAPINLDKSKKTSVNISRAIQQDIKIADIFRSLKITNLSAKFGNGSSGNRGVANRGNLFEPQFAEAIIDWWEGNTISDNKMLAAIEHLDKTYQLKEGKSLKVDIVGGENTPRPLQYAVSGITLKNTKGVGLDVGPSVTDITLTKVNKNNLKEEIYLSLKVGTTVTFFNVGVRTVLTPAEIKTGVIKNKEGLMLLELFGIDPFLFCTVFNGKLKKPVVQKNTVDGDKLQNLLKSGIGHGYHIIHKLTSKILSQKMDTVALNLAVKISNSTVYYGGKTGTGKRIDIEVESADYKFKLNIRDTQGKDGYPTRLMCDFTHKH